MTDSTPATTIKKVVSMKKTVKAKPGPSTWDMVKAAIITLKEKNGSSRQKILSFIEKNYAVTVEGRFRSLVNITLKKNVVLGKLVQVKGSYKLSPEAKKVVKPKKAIVKKPKKITKKAVKKTTKKTVKKTIKPKTVKPKKPAGAKPTATKVSKPKAAAKPKTAKATPKKAAKKV